MKYNKRQTVRAAWRLFISFYNHYAAKCCLCLFVPPLKKIGHAMRIMSIFNELGQLPARKILTLAAMRQLLRIRTLKNITFTPEDFSALLNAACTVKPFLELTCAAIRSALALDHFHEIPSSSA